MTELQAKEKIQKLMAVANCSTTNPNEAATAKKMAAKVAVKNSLMTWFFLTFISAPSSVKKEATPVTDLFLIDLENFKAPIVNILYDMACDHFNCWVFERGNKNIRSFKVECTKEQYNVILKAGSELTKAFRKYRKEISVVRTGSNKTYEFQKLVMDGFYNKYTFDNDKLSTSTWVVGRKINVDIELSKKGGAR